MAFGAGGVGVEKRAVTLLSRRARVRLGDMKHKSVEREEGTEMGKAWSPLDRVCPETKRRR